MAKKKEDLFDPKAIKAFNAEVDKGAEKLKGIKSTAAELNDILQQNVNLPLNLSRTFGKYGSTDGHPSLLFNEILCDSLFKKLGVNND